MWQRVIHGRLIQPTSTIVGAVTNYIFPLTGVFDIKQSYEGNFNIKTSLTGVFDID